MSSEELSARRGQLSAARQSLLDKLLHGSFKNPTAQVISRRSAGPNAPLSFAQQRLWFLNQFDPKGSTYNIPLALCINGPLNIGVLQRTLTEIVHRHEVLRTSFESQNGSSVQIVNSPTSHPIPMIDLSELPAAERTSRASQIASEESERAFRLDEHSLLRTPVLRLGVDDYVLVIVMHHIVSDGWSLGVLFKELNALYTAYSNGQSSPLEELPIQYADYAVWQRGWLSGEALERQLSYWREQLAEMSPVLELPTDHPRPVVQSTRGAHESFTIPASVCEGLRELNRKEGTTLFMTMLAIWQALLYRYTGQQDIVVGSPIAGRNYGEVEGLIGFFINTLVLRTRVDGEMSFREMLKQVREVCLGAYSHQDVPFEKLVEELQPERSLSHTPLFQVMLALQNMPLGDLELPGVTMNSLGIENKTAKFDLNLTAVETGKEMYCSLHYRTDLFELETIRRMVGHLQVMMEEVVKDAGKQICELEILTESEKSEQSEWNRTEREYRREGSLGEIFEEQARERAKETAVVCEGESLNYEELNARANRVANYLRRVGIGAEDRVGLCVERSMEMVVGLLGIVKAGGVYVPLDSSYPKERLAYMLKDSQAQILLTLESLKDFLPCDLVKTVTLDTDWQYIAQHSSENPVNAIEPENGAYIIYTSGSTGRQKAS